MDRIKLISYKGQSILAINFSGLNSNIKEEFKEMIDRASEYISKQPLNSLLTLTDFNGIQFDLEVAFMITNYARQNRPYVKCSALIGIEGYSNIVLNSTKKISRRDNFKTFNTQEAALDWLVQQ